MLSHSYYDLQSKLINCVRPVCDMNSREYDFIATCTLCKYKNRKFIINAAHTIDEAQSCKHQLGVLMPNGEYFYVFNLPSYTFTHNGMDIGINVINENISFLGEDNYIDIEDEIILPSNNFTHFVFFGYPANKYKPRSKQPKAAFARYTGAIVNSIECKNIIPTIKPDKHFCAKLVTENVDCCKDGGSYERIARLPDLKGLSGGPVFGINQNTKFHPVWLGIGIEQYKKSHILVSLAFSAVIAALDKVIYEINGASK